MSEQGKIKDRATFLWEHRKAVAVATVLGIAAVLLFSRFGGNSAQPPSEVLNLDLTPQPTLASPPANEVPDPQSSEPYIVYTSGPDSRGISQGIITTPSGQTIPVECATINFLYSYFDRNNIDSGYKPNLPTVIYASQALTSLEVEQSSVSEADPIYVTRGVNVMTVTSMQDDTLRMLNNTAGVCAGVN